VLTKQLPANGPDPESTRPMAGANGASLPKESSPATLPAPKTVWPSAFKLSNIAATVCILAWLANLVLAGSYLFEGWEQRRLASEIRAALDSISALPGPAEAQIRLTEAASALEAEQRAFTTLASSPEVTQGLLDLAETVGLVILEVVTEPGDPQKVGQNAYGSLLVNLQVAGSAEALAAFLYELEGGALPGGRVDAVSIERIHPPEAGSLKDHTPGDGTEDPVPGWSSRRLVASVDITLYERQGSWD